MVAVRTTLEHGPMKKEVVAFAIDWPGWSRGAKTCDEALEQGISNSRVEGMNTKVRLLIPRAFGFHSAEAALALVMLACGPINLKLPRKRLANPVAK
jgi:hypothetical protein